MGSDAPRKKTVVLVVDDFTDARELYRDYLEFMGYEVVVAQDGPDAVSMAQREHPDIILMDLSLPLMDGLEATRQLKQADETREIPVVAFTGHVSKEYESAALEAGCHDFIAKPAMPDVVEAKLREVLASTRASAASLLARVRKRPKG